MSDDESVATKSIVNPNGNDQDLDVFDEDPETADDPPTKASLRALLAKETDADKRIALRDQLLELEFPTAPTHPDTVLLPTTAMSLEAIPNPDPDPNPKARV